MAVSLVAVAVVITSGSQWAFGQSGTGGTLPEPTEISATPTPEPTPVPTPEPTPEPVLFAIQQLQAELLMLRVAVENMAIDATEIREDTIALRDDLQASDAVRQQQQLQLAERINTAISSIEGHRADTASALPVNGSWAEWFAEWEAWLATDEQARLKTIELFDFNVAFLLEAQQTLARLEAAPAQIGVCNGCVLNR